MTPSHPPDVIDALVGITPGDRTDAVRSNRPDARTHAQGSFDALFHAGRTDTMSTLERYAVATFVAALHQVEPVTAFYADGLTTLVEGGAAVRSAVLAEAASSATTGPYGAFPGPLAAESVPGPEYEVDGIVGAYVLGDRLVAAVEYAHFLVLHPRDASPERLERLLDAGWDTDGVVTLSQLVSYLTFQIRVVAGLTALKADLEGQR